MLAGCGQEGCAVCPRVLWDWGLLVRARFTEGDPTSTVPTLQCGGDSPHTGLVSEPLGPLSSPQGVGVSRVPRGLKGSQVLPGDSVSPAVLTVCFSASADLWPL